MNMFSNIWNLWYSIVAWPIVDAPKFRNGQIATLVTGAFTVGVACAILYCSRRFPPNDPEPAEVETRAESGHEDEKDVAALQVVPI